MVTIILVVYKTNKTLLKNILKRIGKEYKIIIVDNSFNYNFSRFNLGKNIKIIRSKNNGNGAGINLALKNCKTKYALYSDIDVSFKKKFIKEFVNSSKKIKNFSILVPNHGNIKSKKEFIEKYEGEAAVMLFNLKNSKTRDFFDEKYFLYFEETDLLTRCKKNNSKCYLTSKIKIKHFRAKSVNKDLSRVENLRGWHYMWSMFYYNRKNFGYLNACKATVIFFLKDLIMMMIYIFLLNTKEFKKRYYRAYGIITSMLGFKSFLRP